jgi:hypothetical protein
MSDTEPMKKPLRTTVVRLWVAVVLSLLGVELLQYLTFGSTEADGPALPALILLFTGGILVSSGQKSIAIRILSLFITTTLSVLALWITPIGLTQGMSLRDAARYRDELKAELSAPPNFENAWMVNSWKAKRKKFDHRFHWMSKEIDSDIERWATDFHLSVLEAYRNTPAGDTKKAAQILDVSATVFYTLRDTRQSYTAEDDWVARAVSDKKICLQKIQRGDWAGFDRSALERHALADTFRSSFPRLAAIEEEWIFESVAAGHQKTQIEMTPKLIREKCHETEKQLLALKSLDESSGRFRESRKLLFLSALEAVDSETNNHITAGRSDIAYGIARKFAVDWFATAEMLGPEHLKRIEDLREKCRDRADITERAGDTPEITPPPREREIAPPPRPKP